MSDIEFDTQTEQYLHDNQGNLQRYYDCIVNGAYAGLAFTSSISKPDLYRLKVGRHFALANTESEFDGPDILAAIKFLEQTKDKYSEDHPIWNLR